MSDKRHWWNITRQAAEQEAYPTAKDHPSIPYETAEGTKMLTVCANCESLKSVLFLDGDHWYCTKCRNTGNVRPTVVSLHVPGRD